MKKSMLYRMIVIFALALLVRLSFVLVGPQPEIAGDAPGYDIIGWNLANGNGFSMAESAPFTPTARRGPIYPLFLASIFSVFGHNYLAVRLAQGVIGALMALVVFQIAQGVFDDRRIAVLSALLVSFHPVFIYYTGYIMTEMLFTFLLSLTILFFVRSLKSEVLKCSLLTGLFLGLTTLCKPVTLFFPLFILGSLLLVRKGWKQGVLGFLAVTVVMLSVLAPWTIRNYVVFHQFLPVTSSGIGLIWYGSAMAEAELGSEYVGLKASVREESQALTEGLSGIEADRKLLNETLKGIAQDPFWYLRGVVLKMVRLWRYPVGLGFVSQQWPGAVWTLFAFEYVLMLLGGIGLWAWRREWRRFLPLIMVLLYFTLIYGIIHAIPRYHIPVLPYVFILAMAGFVQLVDIAQRTLSSVDVLGRVFRKSM